MLCSLHLMSLAELLIDTDLKILSTLLQEKQDHHRLKIYWGSTRAEVKQESLPYKDRDHALFVAFAPYKNPQYAISVLVEHGGSGGKAAAPIAKKVIKKVLERHELRRNIGNSNGGLFNVTTKVHQSSLGIRDKILSIDYILVFSILVLGIVSMFAMYSTDGGEFKYHTNSHILRFFVFLVYCSFFYFYKMHMKQVTNYIGVFVLLLGVKYFD